ncbi:hypothetical protein PVAND_006224 [Polypedilum vanderplanki]|uniref:Uncharacterized protein n=1 Tax=Polypedilum vanderplanki TaxID=319348 RepID=A0A9J6C2Z4_POLVA|nr:hypothetical protein PVAND_006224 [Polypedilum vanderplanki]
MKVTFIVLVLALFGGQVLSSKVSKPEFLTEKSCDPSYMYIVKTKPAQTLKPEWWFGKEKFTTYKLISIPDFFGKKLDLPEELIVDKTNTTKLIPSVFDISFKNSLNISINPRKPLRVPLTVCERSILVEGQAKHCKTIHNNGTFWVKLSDHKFFLYKTFLILNQNKIYGCNVCEIVLSPNDTINLVSGNYSYTAPASATNQTYPKLIPIKIVKDLFKNAIGLK